MEDSLDDLPRLLSQLGILSTGSYPPRNPYPPIGRLDPSVARKLPRKEKTTDADASALHGLLEATESRLAGLRPELIADRLELLRKTEEEDRLILCLCIARKVAAAITRNGRSEEQVNELFDIGMEAVFAELAKWQTACPIQPEHEDDDCLDSTCKYLTRVAKNAMFPGGRKAAKRKSAVPSKPMPRVELLDRRREQLAKERASAWLWERLLIKEAFWAVVEGRTLNDAMILIAKAQRLSQDETADRLGSRRSIIQGALARLHHESYKRLGVPLAEMGRAAKTDPPELQTLVEDLEDMLAASLQALLA